MVCISISAGDVWICKYADLERGKGIHLIRSLNDFKELEMKEKMKSLHLKKSRIIQKWVELVKNNLSIKRDQWHQAVHLTCYTFINAKTLQFRSKFIKKETEIFDKISALIEKNPYISKWPDLSTILIGTTSWVPVIHYMYVELWSFIRYIG